MFERFTHEAREAVIDAQAGARGLGHDYVGTEHLLIGLVGAPGESLAAQTLVRLGVNPEQVRARAAALAEPGAAASDAEALETIGIDLDAVRRKAEEAFGQGALDRPGRARRWGRRRRRKAPGHLPFTRQAKTALELALREALRLNHRWIGPEHVLLGILRERTGSGARALRSLGITLGEAEAMILDLLREAS
ncbi:MAG TPA: Clp protease N-terminal domain-containing protein [Egibacteraceae bacterium]|nr:Clp protease N-terminal domain-containing protein [Egibacteraceae bacterium]